MKPLYLAILLSLLPVAARAQVFINQAALDQLAGVQPPMAPEMNSPVASKPVLHRHVVAHVMAHVVAHVVAVVAKPMTAAPVVAPAPAVQPVVAKPAPVIVPPAKPVGPVTLAFAAGGTDLPGNAAASLQPICARAGADGLVTIDAYGPADGADMSAPMRTSLTRAFAVRDALTACGVPAAHIIPRADGAVTGKDLDSAVVSLGLGGAGTGK